MTGIALAPREWALAAPWGAALPGELRTLVRVLGREGPATATARACPAIIRVPDRLMGEQARAVLHYLAGWTFIYCPEKQLAQEAAEAISVLIGHSGVLSRTGRPAQRALVVTP